MSDIIHKVLCLISSFVVVYRVFFKLRPADVEFYLSFIESSGTLESVLEFSLISFDVGFLLIKFFSFFGLYIFLILIGLMVAYILYVTNLLISKFFVVYILNILIFALPSYLPAIFLVSTIRQLFSLSFFVYALRSRNKFLRLAFFILAMLAHFTGVVNLCVLLILKLKNFWVYLLSLVLVVIVRVDLGTFFMPIISKYEHYSEDADGLMSISKIVTCLFIIFIALVRGIRKMKVVDWYILLYVSVILFLSVVIPSISLRLFNSIYFIFIIYSVNSVTEILSRNTRKTLIYES